MFPCTVKLEFNDFQKNTTSSQKYASGLYELRGVMSDSKSGGFLASNVPDPDRTRFSFTSVLRERGVDSVVLDVPYEEVERLLLAAREVRGIAKFSFKEGGEHGIIGTLSKNHPVYTPGG